MVETDFSSIPQLALPPSWGVPSLSFSLSLFLSVFLLSLLKESLQTLLHDGTQPELSLDPH